MVLQDFTKLLHHLIQYNQFDNQSFGVIVRQQLCVFVLWADGHWGILLLTGIVLIYEE